MTKAIKIRPATTNDIDILAQMNLDLYSDSGHHRDISIEQMKERFDYFIEGDIWNVDLMYLEDEQQDEQLLGYCLWRYEHDDRDIYIRHFWITEELRGKNYSVLALDALIGQEHWEDKRLRLQIFAENNRMRQYWTLQGFKPRSMILERNQ